ncbi:MAG: MFS transporter, partial [bacterium]
SGLLSLFFGPFSEILGRKAIMLLGIGLFSISSLLVALFPSIWTLGISLFFIGLASAIFDPAMQSYLGDQVPYEKRGWAIAVTEFSWSTSLLVGVPLAGLLIQSFSWNFPFLIFSVSGLAFLFILEKALPLIRLENKGGRKIFAGIWKANPVIFPAAIFSTLAIMTAQSIMIIYGVWMESSFRLSITGLGLTAGIIGGGELLGEVTAGIVGDRFGKRRVVLIYSTLTALVYLIIPFISQFLWSALILLFLLFYFFETAIVATITLFTELLPHERSVMMSVFVTSQSLGGALGALIGPFIFFGKGFALSGILASFFMFLALLIFALWVKEAPNRPSGGVTKV